MLRWYGMTFSYDFLAGEMHTNAWESGVDLALVCAGVCGYFDVVCAAACYAAVGNLYDAGTLPDDMAVSLARHPPSGYRLYTGRGMTLDRFKGLLRQGNPVVVLESECDANLHWTVVT